MNRLFLVAFMLIITGVFVASNIYTLIPIYPNISASINITIEKAVLGGSIFSFFYAIGLLTFGPLSERIGRKKVIVSGLFFSIVTTWFVGFSFNEASLYVFRGLQGIALGSFAPVAFAYTFEIFPVRHQTLVLALINSGFLIAGILGQLMSSSITYFYGWEYVFYCFAGIYLVLFIGSLFIYPSVPVMKKADASLLQDFYKIIKNPSLVICYIITFSILLSFISFYDGIGQYLKGRHGVDEQTLFKIRAIGLIGASLSLFTGKLVQQFGDRRTLLIGLSLATTSLICLLMSKTPGVIAVLSIPFVASISLLFPSIISLVGKLGEHARGSAISLYSFTLLTGASFGPIIASALDFSILLVSLIGVFIFNIALSMRLKLSYEKGYH
ncbi:MFS transporter [Fredinandcohnia onubensis]|uniref:MFS transporter n=1 Tax=Fredinandcohnia onubensis TaxID=1571209 RepID=UPI001FE5DA7B|nr:MFS transporter [Fredinandcohnia onubensis]